MTTLSDATTLTPVAVAEPVCPLCGLAKHLPKGKPLYGTKVCKKCYYAFLNRRQIAYALDSILLWHTAGKLAGMALTMWAQQIMSASGANADLTVLALLVFNIGLSLIALPLLFFFKDGFAGHSLGKLICGIRVVDRTTYQPVGFIASLKRNLPLWVPFAPLIVGFTEGKGPRWGDGWAHTKVIWKKYAGHPLFSGLLACERCQYDLTGNISGVCPECGLPISAANRQRLQEQTSTPAVPDSPTPPVPPVSGA